MPTSSIIFIFSLLMLIPIITCNQCLLTQPHFLPLIMQLPPASSPSCCIQPHVTSTPAILKQPNSSNTSSSSSITVAAHQQLGSPAPPCSRPGRELQWVRVRVRDQEREREMLSFWEIQPVDFFKVISIPFSLLVLILNWWFNHMIGGYDYGYVRWVCVHVV